MSNIRFYHLTSTPLERALPKLLEKARGVDYRILVKAGDEAQLDALNTALWTYDPGSFLAHGAKADGHEAEQPIYLATAWENPNGAKLLAVADGSTPEDANAFERILDLFDGSDEEAVKAARTRWKAYKEAGQELEYWQQNDNGGWMKKA